MPAVKIEEPPIIPSPADNKIPDPGLLDFNVMLAACCKLFPAETILSDDNAPFPLVIETLPLDLLGEASEPSVTRPLDATPVTFDVAKVIDPAVLPEP